MGVCEWALIRNGVFISFVLFAFLLMCYADLLETK